MSLTPTQESTSQIDRVCIPMHGGAHDYDDLLDVVRDRSIGMLGEATHGTYLLGDRVQRFAVERPALEGAFCSCTRWRSSFPRCRMSP